ncbi:hypothetical protein SLEP1_g13001 [Rubroshorea leprosula]|uniref:Uncharacterized protein n=1 Tax=Rubroshorea leprosula TaxID=152421 RepID=A0AAV5IPQ3_9ROSI|nr:hypothetical protein SLEP1_g13001 [Rubroshorea leprosula]
MAQPGKPPPLHVVTPKKQALIKAVGGSPNYMKSTNSSEAKKERTTHKDLESTTESEENKFSSRATDGGALREDGECNSRIETDDNFVMSMEWDKEQFSTSKFDYEAHSPMEIDGEFHFSVEGLLEEPKISLDDSVNSPSKKILVDGVEQEDSEEDSAHNDNFSQVSCALDYEQVSSTEDVFDASAIMEEEEEAQEDLIGIMIIADLAKLQLLEEKVWENEVVETDKMLPGAAKNNGGIQKPENSNLNPAEELPGANDGAGVEKEVAETELFARNQISDSSQNFSRADEFDDEVDNNQYNQKAEAGAVDNNVEERYSIEDIVDESHFLGSQDHLLDGQGQRESTNVVKNTGFSEEGQDRAKECKTPSSMESDEEKNSRMHKSHLVEESTKLEKMEAEGNNGPDVVEIFGTASDISNQELESTSPSQEAK